MVQCTKLLRDAGIEYTPSFLTLSEDAKLKVTDDALSRMMKFITDKYNSLDFAEIERSAGDISRFKYTQMIRENNNTLNSIYEASTDPGAAKYVSVLVDIDRVLDHLEGNRSKYSALYKAGNGMVQLLYTSLTAACLYATGILVSNTIRFVTTEKDTGCEVLYEEIPGSIKHVHIKNIQAASKDIPAITEYICKAAADRNVVHESVSVAIAIAAITAGVIILIPRIIILIREIIYSIYYTRVKIADMLGLQAELIRTNIESLEAGRGNKTVIARQKKIAQKLEIWKGRVALKMDTTEALKQTQVRKENTQLKVDMNDPASPYRPVPSADGLMI